MSCRLLRDVERERACIIRDEEDSSTDDTEQRLKQRLKANRRIMEKQAAKDYAYWYIPVTTCAAVLSMTIKKQHTVGKSHQHHNL